MAIIDELLRKIKRYEHHGKLSAVQRDEIGECLDEVQRLLPRGEFGPWIARNLWFSYGMASYYLKCFRDGQVARRYAQAASSNNKQSEFFKEFDRQHANADGSAKTQKDMTPDDYKKLVTYMRDNMDLTTRLNAAEARVAAQMQEQGRLRNECRTKDIQIAALRRELQLERDGGSNPFGGLFGGGMGSGLTKGEYRQVMSVIHPDKASSPEQAEAFNKIAQIINGKMKTH